MRNKERWGSHVTQGLHSFHISVVKTVKLPSMICALLESLFLASPGLGKKQEKSAKTLENWSFLKSATNPMCYFLVQKQEAWGENKFKLIKTL